MPNIYYLEMLRYGVDLQIIQSRIYEIRERKITPDHDLAEIYGVETRVLNQAVKRIIERFPDDFMFLITKGECLKSNWKVLEAPQTCKTGWIST